MRNRPWNAIAGGDGGGSGGAAAEFTAGVGLRLPIVHGFGLVVKASYTEGTYLPRTCEPGGRARAGPPRQLS